MLPPVAGTTLCADTATGRSTIERLSMETIFMSIPPFHD
jgi:hypothetical protein